MRRALAKAWLVVAGVAVAVAIGVGMYAADGWAAVLAYYGGVAFVVVTAIALSVVLDG